MDRNLEKAELISDKLKEIKRIDKNLRDLEGVDSFRKNNNKTGIVNVYVTTGWEARTVLDDVLLAFIYEREEQRLNNAKNELDNLLNGQVNKIKQYIESEDK